MKKEKSELIPTISLEHWVWEVVGVYKEKKSYLHWGGYLELDGKQLSPDEYISMLEEENKKLKETIKDHQLYEEKLEHRIIEFEELLHWE